MKSSGHSLQTEQAQENKDLKHLHPIHASFLRNYVGLYIVHGLVRSQELKPTVSNSTV